jgi:aminopeptidase
MLYQKYAHLLTNYCLEVKKGDRVMIKSTYLAEPLLIELAKEITLAGGYPFFDIELKNLEATIINHSELSQLDVVNPISKLWSEQFEGYLYIMAPFDIKAEAIDQTKRQAAKAAASPIQKTYAVRTANRSLKRNLCQFPTEHSARVANMTLEEYERFVFNACRLLEEDPIASWQNFGKNQQKIVDYLQTKETIRYVGPNIDLTYSTKGRLWINSDGKTNMPSGEVYTAPVDDSMNGWVHFTLPSIYMGNEVENVRLEIKNGFIESWDASTNKAFLDEVFQIPGARRFGEAAVGTNYQINQMTKNILFDEKIGGTIHLAIGEAYKQCHGINESTIHWDMITDMTDGEIYADGALCYQKGQFIIA